MISPDEIKIKAEKKYPLYLRSILQNTSFFPLVITANKIPAKSLADVQREILALVNQSKEKKGYGFTITYKTIKTKTIGTQSLPETIYFESGKDFLKYLGKEKEVECFVSDHKNILQIFPELHLWLINNPLRVIQYSGQWENIIKVCIYFKNNPRPNLYIRELPINVHTKFIESYQSIIAELLDIIIDPFVNHQEKDFEKRYNLKYRESLVRFRILDKKISQAFFSGIDDIAIPVSQFSKLELPVIKAIIVENKTNLYTTLTLPNMEGAIAIYGSGYGVSNLRNVDWLRNIEILYWGDIDAQGFEILSQVRGYLKQTKSILMDNHTFEKFFENDIGTPTKISIDLNLTDAEKLLYKKLKENNWRLEQEKIPVEYVNSIIGVKSFI